MKRNKKENAAIADENATLLTHVRELQIRLLVTAVVLVGAGVVAYLYYAEILDILRKPLNAPLYTNTVSGDFSFVMKICMVAGIAVSVPLIIYNFIMFVRPAFLEVFTRKRVIMMTAGSILAAAGGMAFGYFFIIPGAIHFFSGFQVSGLKSMIQADGYLNFVVNVIVTFILMFQLPIIASLIDRIKPISPKAMWKGEKWALIGSVLISLVVPFAMDFTTQILIAAPIFILYNISFVVIVFQHAYGRKVQRKTDRVAARIERKAQAAEAKKTHKTARVPATALAATSATIAPNAQLDEVFALQSELHKPVQKAAHQPKKVAPPAMKAKPIAAAVKAPAPHRSTRPAFSDFMGASVRPHPIVPKPVQQSTRPIMAPVTAPSTPTQATPPAVISTPAPIPAAAPAETVNSRAQPTQVIRRAGSIAPPVRTNGLSYRSPRLMSDVR